MARSLAFAGDGSQREFDLRVVETAEGVTITPPNVPVLGSATVTQIQTNPLRYRLHDPVIFSGINNDVSVLADPEGGIRTLSQFSFPGSPQEWREIALGLSGTLANLIGAWEENPEAIVITVPGLADLVLLGPRAPGVDLEDNVEPYVWRLSEDQWNTAWGGQPIHTITNLPDPTPSDSTIVHKGWLRTFDELSQSDKDGLRITFAAEGPPGIPVTISVETVTG